ncbi:putative RNA-directed DNA polymerase, eukaryota, reverse transcriptase zinc-binding domain protein [Tanacetum coccineum]
MLKDSIVDLSTVIPHVSLNTNDNFELEKVMTVDEIRMVVWDCGSQKAPSPNGVLFLFLKTYWDLLKDDVVEAVRHAFDSFTNPKGANSSFITLILKWYKKKKQKLMLFKVDFEKDFDTVSWKYLDHMPRNLGSPSCEFSIKHGVRQGDPLSPLLFIIVMEGLHLALKDAVSTCLLRGTKARHG